VVVGVVEVDEAEDALVVEATINQVCEGVYASLELAVELAQLSVDDGCQSEVEADALPQLLVEESVKVSTCEPLRLGAEETVPISEAVSVSTETVEEGTVPFSPPWVGDADGSSDQLVAV